MAEDDGDRSPDPDSTEHDAFLRAVAEAPVRAPPPSRKEPDPARLAHFRIAGRLGSGGMGVVYRAHDESLHRDVALKLLPQEHTTDPTRRQRFLREARAAGSLVHPNVAGVHQIGEADGRVFIAMELVEGVTLRQRIERGPLSASEIRPLAVQIARGLAAAHAKGIVHRDLKPENVMVTPSGHVKLLDFGLAKSALSSESEEALANAETEAQITSDGMVLGSSAYMSPEQTFGMPVDARSDVFSFGIVLYEALAGKKPFQGTTLGEMRAAIAREPHAALDARIDPTLRAIVERCLAKRARDRFEDAEAIARALEGAPFDAPSGTVTREALAPSAPRQPARLPRTALIAGGLAVALVGATLLARKSEAPAPVVVRPPPVEAADAAPSALSRSSVAEAEQAFEDALQSFHDGTGRAASLFTKAVTSDPSFGGAHLRLSMIADDAARPHFWRAVALEDGLSAQDRALLDLLVAENAETDQTRAVLDGLDGYLARYPLDAMAWRARWSLSVSSSERCEVADRAASADPSSVAAIVARAECLERSNEDGARDLLDRCLTMAPLASDCLLSRMELEMATGACRDLEVDARRLLGFQPTNRAGRDDFADALASNDAPLDAVRDALGPVQGLVDREEDFPRAALIALYQGDFLEVERVARAALADAEASVDTREHAGPTRALLLAYAESGRTADAARVAEDFLARSAAWTSGPPAARYEGAMVAAMARGGRMAPGEAAARTARALRTLLGDGVDPYDAWVAEYGEVVATPKEARAAVAQLGHLGISLDAHPWSVAIARTMALAGRGETMRPRLERAAKACRPVTDARTVLESRLALGRLDEEKHDTKGACASYASVIARWGDPRPRSIMADEARARMRALGCGR